MDLATPDHLHEPISHLLQLEPTPDGVRVGVGQLDTARVAEEVGSMKEVDVESVALDPLPEVEQTAQVADPVSDLDPERLLDGVGR